MTPRTRAGLRKFRPVAPGGRVALVAPATPLGRDEFDAGCAELRRLGFEPVFDDRVFERRGFVAGSSRLRAEALMDVCARAEVDAVLAIRGGYGSVELLPWLAVSAFERLRTAVIGYSDITSLHIYLNCMAGMTSVHGTMIDRRMSRGPSAYDVVSWLASLSADPLGVVAADGLEALQNGEAAGPLFGGTITQIAASLGTPYAFDPPGGHVLFLDDVDERPYRLQRLLVQLRLSGRLAKASAVIFGEMPGCDEPGGAITARAVVADCLSDFPGPVLYGLPSGHTAATPPISMPFGVHVRVTGGPHPKVVFDEAAAE